MNKYIAFDIGGTQVKHGLLLENGSILSKGSYDTPSTSLEMFIEKIVNTVKSYPENTSVSGVAISLPGYINPHTGYSERAGAISVLDGQNLKILLETAISLPVEIENDGNCAAIAEKISGNAKNCTDFICVTVGTGIGGGIFIDGKLVHGHSFRGGEFGFMITESTENVWNNNASTTALIKSYKKLKGINETKKVDGETIFLKAAKDSSVRRLVERWVKILCYGIYNLAATLNPQKILIGGGVLGQEGLIKMINNQLDRLYWWKDIKIPVESCKHQNDAGMIGAMYHFQQKQQRESNTREQDI
ncbi:ROK family protein [Neobacillus drentensis]|uniref:ROK family protein n=1 Tax=Neobacillus drentensis TaxID=220684 RepID=UPI001F282CA0|nr:ROK family protein [Neobacillus drentensis]ULT56493.1 ROK family protein [Neobacillus drentensis]